jgi:hypothetical protein
MNNNNKADTRQECCCKDANAEPHCCSGARINDILPSDDDLLKSIISSPQIQQVSTQLTIHDKIGSWKARWGINRMNYKVSPGIYCVGDADKNSPVLVTANYKMSFDMLRKELSGLNAWILVLDTKGINVWCAAGKGTFGTDELVRRIAVVNLSSIVSHKTLILPQLSASGVSAHEVQKRSGFKVVYGPVRAADIAAFLQAGMKATSEMRKVRFNIYDRLVLTPIELTGTFKTSLMIFGLLFILNLILGAGSFGIVDFYGYVGALLIGCVVVPVLLPWIPGPAFAWKGWLMGIFWAVALNILNGWPLYPQYGLLKALAYVFILPAVAAFYAMNFTGSSTYTSFSGVLKEMKTAVPAIFASLTIGVILIILAALNPSI